MGSLIYRSCFAAVALFFAVMTTLLIRSQYFPDARSAWREVPPEHVLRLILKQSEMPDLTTYYDGEMIGSTHISSKNNPDHTRRYHIRGNVLLRFMKESHHRIAYDADILIDPSLSVASIEATLNLRDPAYRLILHINPQTQYLSYQFFLEEAMLKENSGTFRELLSNDLLATLGLNGSINLETIIPSNSPRATANPVTASTEKITVSGEPIDVYRLFLSDSNIQIDVNQIGQILRIKTPYLLEMTMEGVDL